MTARVTSSASLSLGGIPTAGRQGARWGAAFSRSSMVTYSAVARVSRSASTGPPGSTLGSSADHGHPPLNCAPIPWNQSSSGATTSGQRRQGLETFIRGYATTTRALLGLADWLHSWGVTRVVMESTSAYWKGVFYLLEAEGFDCWLVNARDVKNVPGRPKTDKADAVWLAKVAERGMCRPSLVQPRPIRQLRDLTRYRRALIRDRTREMQRVEK